jgi:RAD3-like DEAD/DEAH box helicase/type III restriction/modification enzyme restriction subunit
MGRVPGAVDYRQLLTSLASADFGELRPAQDAVLDRYRDEHSSTLDLAVELPTGAGKTLIALLIAEAWRGENHRAAILTANKTLARQMESEGQRLGISVVRMEGSRDEITPSERRRYHRAQAVGVMNYWVYFNQNPAIDPAALLLMDDAHLAEHCLHSLYSFEVDRMEHSALFESLVAELARRFPNYGVLQDALDEGAKPLASTELLSFLDQEEIAERFQEIVDASPDIATHNDLRFRWRRIRDRVTESNLYLSHRSLWLRPAVYPLIDNPHYAQARQRIYFSATIGNTGDLARRLGTHQIEKIQVAAEHSEITYGRRMILMNVEETSTIPRRLGRVILEALMIHPKSVWLCASRADAAGWKQAISDWLAQNGLLHPTWTLTSLGNEMDQFKAAPAGHLFVAGRFDGMDFKADECRLVVLATLPRAINLQEEFYSAYLRDAGFMLRRLNQRIVQALGRCNRAEDDFALYVLADPRFSTHFGRESQRVGLPRNMIAEIDSGEDAAEASDTEIVDRVREFLSGNFRHFDTDLAEHIDAVPDTPSDAVADDEDSTDEIAGWLELFARQNYLRAAEHFGASVDQAPSEGELGAFMRWCQAKAEFLAGEQGNLASAENARALLERAIGHGRTSSWFNRQRAALNRYLQQQPDEGLAPEDYGRVVVGVFDERLENLGRRGPRFERWSNRLRAHLESDSHDAYTAGLLELGELLAFTAARPSHTAATDCRWRSVVGNTREVVTFEAKVEHEPSGQINPTAVGQAHNQLARAIQEFEGRGYTVRATVVTHLDQIAPAAEGSLGEIRIVSKDAVLSLFDSVLQLFSEYRDGWSVDDLNARRAAAAAVIPQFPEAGWLTRSLSHDLVWVGDQELTAEWV